MNRKSNPWVSLAALLLLAVIVVVACTSCASTEAEAAETQNRFVVEHKEHCKSPGGVDLYIITDTETGVQYLMVDVYNGAGLTVLQPGVEEEAEK